MKEKEEILKIIEFDLELIKRMISEENTEKLYIDLECIRYDLEYVIKRMNGY